MTYELWSGTSGNLLGAFPTEGEAFEALRRAAKRNGPEYVSSLALLVEDDDGKSALIAEGEDLVRRIPPRCSVCHTPVPAPYRKCPKCRKSRDKRLPRRPCPGCGGERDKQRPYCSDCRVRFGLDHPDQKKNATLRRLYGITIWDYERLEAAQGGGCAVCGRKPDHHKYLAVDHDHITKQIRGLLCTHCNHWVIGRRRDPGLLRRAAEYLEAPPAHGLGLGPVPKRRRRGRRVVQGALRSVLLVNSSE